MNALRIAVICADLNPEDLGGAEVHIVEVIRGLAARGHELHVFVGNSLRSQKLFGENVTVHNVTYKKRRNFSSAAFNRAVVKQIAGMGLEFDLLHAKQAYPQGIAGMRLKKKLGVPLYITVQNPLAYKEELVLTGFGKILSPFLFFLGWQVKRALKSCDVAACVSVFSEEASKVMGAKRTVRIPNGIDLKKFKFFDGQRNEFELVTTSTLIPRNGIDVLIESLPAVIKKFPKTHLKIAGDGPLKGELVKRINQLGIAEHVTFLGTLNHDKVPALVKKAHLFVRPSRFEGFGVSFIEAMALGTPVVTCPVGGIPDFVTDGETGMLVPAEDVEALSNAICYAFKHEENMIAIAKKARALVEERYDWEKIVDAVEAGYGAVIK